MVFRALDRAKSAKRVTRQSSVEDLRHAIAFAGLTPYISQEAADHWAGDWKQAGFRLVE